VTEHLYACILPVFMNYLPKSHNLKQLHDLAVLQCDEIATVFPQDRKFKRRCFEQLKRACIEARYPEPFTVAEEELDWLEMRVKRLKERAERLCRERIESMAASD
jgi:hypothetical protein